MRPDCMHKAETILPLETILWKLDFSWDMNGSYRYLKQFRRYDDMYTYVFAYWSVLSHTKICN